MSAKKELSEIEREYREVSELRRPLHARRKELEQRLLNPADGHDYETASREFQTNTEELLAVSQRLILLVREMRTAIESEKRTVVEREAKDQDE